MIIKKLLSPSEMPFKRIFPHLHLLSVRSYSSLSLYTSDIEAQYRIPGYIQLVGDWDGDGVDTGWKPCNVPPIHFYIA